MHFPPLRSYHTRRLQTNLVRYVNWFEAVRTPNRGKLNQIVHRKKTNPNCAPKIHKNSRKNSVGNLEKLIQWWLNRENWDLASNAEVLVAGDVCRSPRRDKTQAHLSRRHTLNSRPGGVHVRGGHPQCTQWDDFQCQLGDFGDEFVDSERQAAVEQSSGVPRVKGWGREILLFFFCDVL